MTEQMDEYKSLFIVESTYDYQEWIIYLVDSEHEISKKPQSWRNVW